MPFSGIRLVGGNRDNKGRVEINYEGSWGTVCDDDWDINDAHVVCRMLGYQIATSAPRGAHFGQGTGNIVLDDVQCTGQENSIDGCPHNGYLSHNCGHHEDAGVVCGGIFDLISLNDLFCLFLFIFGNTYQITQNAIFRNSLSWWE